MPQVSTPCPKNIQSMDNSLISLENQVRIDTPHQHLVAELSTSLESIQNIEQDYIDLFTYAKKGHMTKYIHMYRPDIYDAVIQQDSFYPFKMECDLLLQKADRIVSSFSGVTEAIEIGPGAKLPVVSKTIPLLESLRQRFCVDVYKAMDINPIYAQQACQIIQEQMPSIKTEAIELDFLSRKNLSNNIIDSFQNGRRKLIFALGQPIFANNPHEDTQKFLDNITTLLSKEDYLLFGIDTNRDEKMLERAYNTHLFYELLLNTMYYLKNKLSLIEFNPEEFELVYRWNTEESSVDLLLKPTCKQVVTIRNEKLMLYPDQEFHISSSRKPTINKIKEYLAKAALEIKDVISLEHQKENKFSMIIVQKSTKY
ncbi:MAG: L-histidine N(alpha)-methyltransferase [Candidatus Paracaedibacter sp.]